jgi:tetratricopeptide (TPR) repeat protein
VGPENFLQVFHRLRNPSYNLLPFWMVRFGSSSSELLQVLVTGGLLGLAAWSGMLLALFQVVKKIGRKEPGLAASAVIHMALFFVLPFNNLLWITLGLTALAALNELRHHLPDLVKDVVILLSAIRVVSPNNIKTMKTQAGFSLTVSIVVVALAALMAYGAGRVWAASVFFEFSRQSALRNEGVATYQNLQKAIALQPNNPAYRRSYATTNLAIAQSLASKPDLSESERETLTQLIQQSIREARNAATINPVETENWENLAGIYTNLLEIQGADEWALAANIQAIQTDPVSPALRLALGNLNLRLGKTDDALRAYEQAIQLKPDWVDAFGNYGVALEQKKELALALQSFQKARSLSPEGSEVAKALDERIAALQEQLAEQQKKQAAAEAKNGQQASLPAPTQPSVPSAPQQQSVPGGFEEVVSGQQPAEQQSTPEPTGNVVLPSNVGF